MEHYNSVLYGPVNAFLAWLLGPVSGAPAWWREGIQIGGFRIAGIAPRHGNEAVAWLPDHLIMALLVFLVCAGIGLAVRRSIKANAGTPRGVQNLFEVFVAFLRNLNKENIPHHSDRYLPIAGAFFFFITIGNLLGQLFFLQPPTANLNTTFALSLTCLFYFNAAGIRAHGPVGYLKQFLGPSLALAILVFPIEIIGNLARGLSLAMRLYGNIFGEHTATNEFVKLLPLLVPLPMNALGVFTSFLQAFVFTLLTAIYIGGAIAHEH